MSRVIGYGICSICLESVILLVGAQDYIHQTPDVTHGPTLKVWDNDWDNQ